MASYKSVLITGASSGIGRALAEALAGPGVVLHLGGRDAARLEAAAAACRAKGARVETRIAEVTDAAAMIDWIGAALPLDLAIANAGISGGVGVGRGENPEQARAIFAVNLEGALNTALPAIAAMRAAGRGTVAVVASIAAFLPLPGAPAYGASKAALDAWAVAAAAALAREGVRLVSVCPGFVRTPMTTGNPYPMPGQMDADRAARIILAGLAKGRRRIVFPWWMGALARLGGLLPIGLLARLPGKPALSPRP